MLSSYAQCSVRPFILASNTLTLIGTHLCQLSLSKYHLMPQTPLKVGFGGGGGHLPSQTIISKKGWPEAIRQWNCQASLGNDSHLPCAQLGLQQPQNQHSGCHFQRLLLHLATQLSMEIKKMNVPVFLEGFPSLCAATYYFLQKI